MMFHQDKTKDEVNSFKNIIKEASTTLGNDDNAFPAALSSRHYFHMLSVHIYVSSFITKCNKLILC